jgi:hypothetical protein
MFCGISLGMFVEMVTIFTSNPAGNVDGAVGVGVGTDARHMRIRLARLNRTDEVVTLFSVAVVAAEVMSCVEGVAANAVPRGAT